MVNVIKKIVLCILLLSIIQISSALPTTGAATDVNSNGFNVSCGGISGSEAWVMFGDYPDRENWASATYTATGGTAAVQVIGVPIYGGESVYYQCCDSSGCGNELTANIPAVTPMPTTTYGKLIQNITKSRFYVPVIGESMLQSYTMVMPAVVMFGTMFLFFMIGVWYRTRSVRMIMIVGILLCPFILYAWSGLYLGLPSLAPALICGLLAAGLSGVLFSFMRK